MDETPDVSHQLETLLRSQAECYERVLAFSRAQLACIDGDDTAGLLKALSQKQAIMQEVAALSEQTAPLLAAWDVSKDDLPADRRAAVEDAHAAVKEVLAEVIAIEDAGRHQLQDRKGDSGEQIKTVQRGKQMLKAYGAAPKPEGGRFTDNRK